MAASVGPLLIGYDGSENARFAIERAAALFGGSRAVVLTVWQPSAHIGGMMWSDATANLDFAELDRVAAERGDRLADEGAVIARAAGFEAEALAVQAAGPVWKEIVDIAERHDASVVVMGSRGLTGIRSLLLGSVSNAVVHHACRPVLVIHGATHDAAQTPSPAEPSR
jgi:nucleotide-binding universal stress UspA family protein